MTDLPTAHVSRLYPTAPPSGTDGMAVDRLGQLVDRLGDADMDSPGLLELLDGRLRGCAGSHRGLLALADTRLRAVARWARCLSPANLASVVGCTTSRLGDAGRLGAGDAALLSGHGIALASRGHTGRALVGLGLEELRQELRHSRGRLSDMAGYEVRLLMPHRSAMGRAVDGLVREEARQAGYRLLFVPGPTVTHIGLDRDAALPVDLHYRSVRTTDSVDHLFDWMVGRGLSRQIGRLTQLVDGSRRLWAGLTSPDN